MGGSKAKSQRDNVERSKDRSQIMRETTWGGVKARARETTCLFEAVGARRVL